ncbi:hypothetical protein R1sor_005531 [Riccia sorocarpa]|uniref:AAA+ ATPase domain-containing protein n=1 Tax=Riccia sorocarpa TaxID=122646 RepID=A0ABD3HP93_9MARC
MEKDSDPKGVWRLANLANDLLTSTVVGAFCLHAADEWFLKTVVGVLLAFLWKRYFYNWSNDRIAQSHAAAATNRLLALNKLVTKYWEGVTANSKPKCTCSVGSCKDTPAEAAPIAASVEDKEDYRSDIPEELSGTFWAELLDDKSHRRALISLSLSLKHVIGDVWPVIERAKKLRASETGAAGGDIEVVNLIQGSRRIIQTHVILRPDLIENLKNIVAEAAKIDKDCTLQLDGCLIFKSTENGVKMLKLDDISVPMITHAESAAGVLSCIKGLHLDGAVLKATASKQLRTVVLKITRREKSSGGLAILKCMEPLPLKVSEEVFIHASKRVKVDGHYLDVVSAAASIQDVQLRKVLRDWIPAAILITSLGNGVWKLARPYVSVLSIKVNYTGYAWLLPGLAICLLQLLPSRLEECIKGGVKNVTRTLFSIYEYLQAVRSESKLSSVVAPAAISKTKRSPSPPPPPPPPPPPTASTKPGTKPETPTPGDTADGKPAVPEKPVTDPDWQWPSFEEYTESSKYGGPSKLKECEAAPDGKNSPFQVVYKRMPNKQWPDVVSINLTSPVLIRIIQKLLPYKKDLQYVETPSILGKELFLVMNQLIEYQVSAGDVDPTEGGREGAGLIELETAKLHLHHLVRFLKKEYHDVRVRVERMTEDKTVPWDMLWAFFPPGAKVGYICRVSKEQLLALVKSANFKYTQSRKQWKFDVVLDVYDYNGRSYRKCNITKEIDEFEGEVEFHKLDVFPLEFSEQADTLEETCLANGRKFCSYVMKQNYLYMHYRGPLVHYQKEQGCWGLFSCNADGRVMIDLGSFAKMNPSCPMGNSQPRTGVLRGKEQMTTCDISNDTNLIYAPAIVYGFSFSQKQWGMFAVSGFSEISFDSSAFDNLVMHEDEKTLMCDLISQHLSPDPEPTPSSEEDSKPEPQLVRVDPITNKGEGCIFLCYGPPGTGKTLTAESMAEKLRRPLWALSVSELGTNAASLEATLTKVLDIAASWRAVLLLDEADVYLESRKISDVSRNAMTGVFLRLLEYYRGVLFLTTNRVMTFDEAFLSRISMFLNYKKLETAQRELVWRKLLARALIPDVTDSLISELAEVDLNGRCIRNVIQTAQTLAKSRGEEFVANHVKSVLKVTATSLDVLRTSMGCHVSDLSYFM